MKKVTETIYLLSDGIIVILSCIISITSNVLYIKVLGAIIPILITIKTIMIIKDIK